jgi:hypothetical protein
LNNRPHPTLSSEERALTFPASLEKPSAGLIGQPFEQTKSVAGEILSPRERTQVRASVKTK